MDAEAAPQTAPQIGSWASFRGWGLRRRPDRVLLLFPDKTVFLVFVRVCVAR